MENIMNEVTKQKAIKFAIHFWYVIVIVVVSGVAIVLWQNNQDNKKQIVDMKRQLNITEDIAATEARLEEVKQREVQYKELAKQNDKLFQTLTILEKKNKELEKRKKEVIRNEIEKYTTNDIHNAFSGLGIDNTITSSN